MMERRIRNELMAVAESLRRAEFWRQVMICWLAAAGVAVLFLLIQGASGWISSLEWLIPLAVGGIGTLAIWLRDLQWETRQPDFREAVQVIENEHPEVRHLLSAAAEQKPDPDTGDFRYLQLRVIDEALQHPSRAAWHQKLDEKLYVTKAKTVGAVVVFFAVILVTGYGSVRSRPVFASAFGSVLSKEVTVSPGDTEVERGSSLVISARFGGDVPAEASLVLVTASGKTKRMALERHLADPVFGTSLAEVTEAGIYYIEYGGDKTRDFKISVFDYPALVRADAALHFPDYTGLTNKTIPDTLRVSAVEGSRLTYTLQLNKPVTKATFVSREGGLLNLDVQSNAVALLSDFPLTNSGRYSLALRDADGRTNKFPTEFYVQVLPNKRPELKLIFPRGDTRVSKIEELQLQGEALDDFGLLKYGFGYAVAGADPKLVEIGHDAPGRRKRTFSYTIPLETLGLDEDQVVSYFVWADDYGPDGKSRRTFSDMFFAEVRPFEEVFRAEQSGGGQQGGGGQGGGQGNEGVQLVEMQKEIAIATWKLQQEKAASATPKIP